jgi:mannose-6-phosphate isomerase-like protein (cupin superfamily)
MTNTESASADVSNPMRHRVCELSDLQRDRNGNSWHQFLKTPSLYSGLYVLQAGSEDGQQPHVHDELYYVLQGKGKIVLGDEEATTPVKTGSIIFVKAEVAHQFRDIEEDLHLLVVFSTGPTDASQSADQ